MKIKELKKTLKKEILSCNHVYIIGHNYIDLDAYGAMVGISKIVEKFNKNCHVVIEARDNMGYAPVTKLNLSTEKLEALGWKPFFKLEEMFDRLINYYKSIQ